MSRSNSVRCLSDLCAVATVANMRRDGDSFSLTQTTRGSTYRLPYARMKNAVLGKKYELSLVFVGEARARALNVKYRKKSYVPNVLAFPLSKEVGEIFICPTVAVKEARSFGMSARKMTAYLFIHALLHLEGLAHGATMERKEQELLRKFAIAGSRS